MAFIWYDFPMSVDQMKSAAEILSLYERRGQRIPETTEFKNLGIENGAVFHERLQAAGTKLSKEVLDLMKDEKRILPFGAEVIDESVPLVLLAFLTTNYNEDNSKYYHRVDFELIKAPTDIGDKIMDSTYLYDKCSSATEYVQKKEPLGERVCEMAFSKWDDETWYQHHRKTNPKYSRQVDATGVRIPIGKEMLAASEGIPKIQAKQEGVTNTSLLEVAQVGVMRWAVRNGYEPATIADAQLWERVQAGDSDFYIEDDINEKYKTKNPDYVFWKDPNKGKYKYEENGEWKSQVRIKFEKKFYPHEQKNAWDTANGVSDLVKNVLGG